jgi:hypothetical protein
VDVRGFLVAEARTIAESGLQHLNQHQVLRVMLMRAARCRCAPDHCQGGPGTARS